MTRPRALVTGASGFTGGHLAARLVASGWDVTALCRGTSDAAHLDPTVRVVRIDDRERAADVARSIDDAMGTDAPQAVFSLATQREHRSLAEAASMLDANVRLPALLAAALAERGGGALVTSASYMLGSSGTAPSMFSASRGAVDPILAWASRHADVRCITLSYTSIYGPGDRRAKVLAALIRAAREGTSIDMVDPSRALDLIHVRDAVEAQLTAAQLLAAGHADGPARFDVTSGCTVTLAELVAAVEAALDKPIDARWGARGATPSDAVLAPPDTRWLPGWEPHVPLSEGLREIASSQTP